MHGLVPLCSLHRDRRLTWDYYGHPVRQINAGSILNEPTAAALAYGLDRLDNEQHVLVFDLGGGTLDVSLLEMMEGVFEVKATKGDSRLGGVDFDRVLAQLIADELRRQENLEINVSGEADDDPAVIAVMEAAERAKMDLSGQDSTTVQRPRHRGCGRSHR